MHEVDKKRVVIVKVKVPRYAKAGQFVNVRRRRRSRKVFTLNSLTTTKI